MAKVIQLIPKIKRGPFICHMSWLDPPSDAQIKRWEKMAKRKKNRIKK